MEPITAQEDFRNIPENFNWCFCIRLCPICDVKGPHKMASIYGSVLINPMRILCVCVTCGCKYHMPRD